jgi:hypothetical protein
MAQGHQLSNTLVTPFTKSFIREISVPKTVSSVRPEGKLPRTRREDTWKTIESGISHDGLSKNFSTPDKGEAGCGGRDYIYFREAGRL